MIFVDTNVFMYAVGRRHPLQTEARAFFEHAMTDKRLQLYSSAKVLQELLHAYLPVRRIETLDAALHLAKSCLQDIWSIEVEDVRLARTLLEDFPDLGARDLLHLASCRRRGIEEIKTFDRALLAASRCQNGEDSS